MKAIILVAGIGKRLRLQIPKCLLKINNLTLLDRYLEALGKVGILDVTLVVGYKKEMIINHVPSNVKFIGNPEFTKGSILSLYEARDELKGDVLLMDGDVYFEEELLDKFLSTSGENAVALDTTSCGTGEEMMVEVKDEKVLNIGRNLSGIGEAVGFYKLNNQACKVLRDILHRYVNSGKLELGYEDILPDLLQRIIFEPVDISGLKWVEIDFKEDISRARSMDEED